MSNRSEASAWLEKADHDLLAVDVISAASDPPWDIVVFHAQQAAEKLLKALLVSHGHQPPKVHDLMRLLTLCVPYGAELAQFADDCAFLSPLAVRSRYPGNEPETAREDAEKGAAIARRIRDAVLEHLPSGGQ